MIDLTNEGDANKLPADASRLLVHLERYLKLEAIDKLTVIFTALVVGGVIIALSTSAIFFLSTGLVKSLSSLIGNESLAYYIVGGLLLVIIIVFYVNRKKWVEQKVVKAISEEMLAPQVNEVEKEA